MRVVVVAVLLMTSVYAARPSLSGPAGTAACSTVCCCKSVVVVVRVPWLVAPRFTPLPAEVATPCLANELGVDEGQAALGVEHGSPCVLVKRLPWALMDLRHERDNNNEQHPPQSRYAALCISERAAAYRR